MRTRYITLFLLVAHFGIAQITLTFPVDRAVFQRDNSNSGVVHIVGSFQGDIDAVEARLVPISASQGVATNWRLIDDKPLGGGFNGAITGLGGWYQLQVRTVKASITKDVAVVQRVGIGEVFVIAGQSNARGRTTAFGAKGAADDRVNTLDFYNESLSLQLPKQMVFAKINAQTNVGPFGSTAWCWGELGDLLVRRLNVPVLFLNAAFEGSTTQNWRESAEGKNTQNVNPGFGMPDGFPYINLRNVLNYHVNLLGVRALLWHQGETDTLPVNTTEENYFSNLRQLINITRQQSGKNLSWVVSRVSYTFGGFTSQNIIRAQNRIADTPLNNAFRGPFTDTIQVNNTPPRFDGVHFGNIAGGSQGLTQLASAWNESLSNSFFQGSIPHQGKAALPVTFVGCDVANQIQLRLPEGYADYEWSNGARGINLFTSLGRYSGFVKDANGNTFMTTSVDVGRLYPTTPPSIVAETSPVFCADGSTILRAEGGNYTNYVWTTGERSGRITIKTPGEFFARGVDNKNCASPVSNSIRTTVNPLPPKPSIIAETSLTVCEGQEIRLRAQGATTPVWSIGTTNAAQVSVKAVGETNITLRNRDNNGCVSPSSDAVKATILKAPSTPDLRQSGTFTLEAFLASPIGDEVFQWTKDDKVLSLNEKEIKVSETGLYKVSAIEQYKLANNQTLTCVSQPSGITSYVIDPVLKNLSIYPNPSINKKVYLETRENLKDVYLSIYTVWGQLVRQIQIDDTAKRTLIDLGTLNRGKYIFKITATGLSTQQNVIVE